MSLRAPGEVPGDGETLRPGSHYGTLGVSRDATTQEIRRAYRRMALKWHPDKHPAADRAAAERTFVQIGAAYEVLSDEHKRAAYDRGGDQLVNGSNFGGPGSPFDFFRASQMFNENFGESLAQDWRPEQPRPTECTTPRSHHEHCSAPITRTESLRRAEPIASSTPHESLHAGGVAIGMRVSGTLVRNGKRVTVTINEDGTSDEKEEEGAQGAYSYVSKTGEGGSSTMIQFNGSIGEALADAVLPGIVQRLPVVGDMARRAMSWVPTLTCVGCCYACCCR